MSELAAFAVEALSWAMVLSGSAFVLIGAIGLLRMPDVYTRVHAVSIIDTAGAGLILVGLMLQAGLGLITLKLLFLLALLVFTGPVATHALAQAALHEGVKPILHEDRRKGRDGESADASAGKSS